MAVVRPICDYTGTLKEIQAGDTLVGGGNMPAYVQDGAIIMSVTGAWAGAIPLVSDINGWLMSNTGQLLIAGVL